MVQETISAPIRALHPWRYGASAVDACLLCQLKDMYPFPFPPLWAFPTAHVVDESEDLWTFRQVEISVGD